jgi:hypothetical protein
VFGLLDVFLVLMLEFDIVFDVVLNLLVFLGEGAL